MTTAISRLLRNANCAAVAAEIGVSRGYIWRLRRGQSVLADLALVGPLATALNLPEATVAAAARDDAQRARASRTIARREKGAA